jgi:UDP:flavonoid glycosyltransferase YjiC (YdhE family)
MAFPKSVHPYVQKNGLTAVTCGKNWGEQDAKKNATDWEHLRDYAARQVANDRAINIIQTEYAIALQDLLEISTDADLVICSSQREYLGQIISEVHDLPFASISLMPFLQCYTTIQNPEANLAYLAAFNDLRTQAQLSPLSSEAWFQWNQEHPQRAILASSSHFSQVLNHCRHYQQTGFWFYDDPDWQDWQPDQELQQFMTTEPKPLVLTFSSLPLVDAQSVLIPHVQAAAQLGRRLLVQQGWADFNASLLPDDIDQSQVLFRGFMPQDWLFSQAAAVIHHGGIGTTARALRNDCPMLVEPYGNDQFFNAKQVLALNVGTAMHPHRLTANGLAQVLNTKVLTDECKQNTQQLGAKIRQEQGLDKACDLVESWLE